MKSFLQTVVFATSLLAPITAAWCDPMQGRAHSNEQIVVGNFLSGGVDGHLPAGWQHLAFDTIPSHTHYESVEDGGQVVIRAHSQSSASGLVRKIEIDPRDYPIVEWRWKVDQVLKKGNARMKKGDDYAARLYISFAYDPSKLSFVERVRYKAIKMLYGEYPPTAVLNYIWGNTVPVNTILPSPYTDRSIMVVVQSGNSRARKWIKEERNLLADFRKAFNAEPPIISSVAIMTDSDNTGESALAWYGDIVFRRE